MVLARALFANAVARNASQFFKNVTTTRGTIHGQTAAGGRVLLAKLGGRQPAQKFFILNPTVPTAIYQELFVRLSA